KNSVILKAASVFALAAQMLLVSGFQYETAFADTYTISGTSSVVGTVASVSGTAFVNDNGANAQNIHIAIDWNSDKGATINKSQAVAIADSLVHTTCNANGCTVTWGSTTND